MRALSLPSAPLRQRGRCSRERRRQGPFETPVRQPVQLRQLGTPRFPIGQSRQVRVNSSSSDEAPINSGSSESTSDHLPEEYADKDSVPEFEPDDLANLNRGFIRERALQEYQQELLNEEPDFFRCACLIAQSEYPELDPASCTLELDRIAQLVEQQLPVEQERYPMRVLQTISKVLYSELGFFGNIENYYDPDNSYINKVLERRTGLPITLALVYMEVAKRVGLRMVGVNLPGHFMIRPAIGELEVLVDAFQAGEVCCLEDAQSTLSLVLGKSIKLDPAWVKVVDALPPRKFLLRLLNNLKLLYRTRNHDRLLRIIRYMRLTDPSSMSIVRDEGICLYGMDRLSEAKVLLTQYLKAAPQADDTVKVKLLVDKITSLLQFRRSPPA